MIDILRSINNNSNNTDNSNAFYHREREREREREILEAQLRVVQALLGPGPGEVGRAPAFRRLNYTDRQNQNY